MIRGITDYGEGNGPYIAINDGLNLDAWANFPHGADRMVLDTHPFLAFDGLPKTAPVVTDDGLGEPGGTWPSQPCAWGSGLNTRSDFLRPFRVIQTLTDLYISKLYFGVTISGEFSASYTECGLFLAGSNDATTDGGNCTQFIQWQSWNQTFKEGILDFTEAEMDALQNWWFWTWKVCLSFRRYKLLDVEADIVHPLIGWSFVCVR
jgi:glucan 1,3-beta-glucosidase